MSSVFYVVATDVSGKKHDLAKFFTKKDAENHAERIHVGPAPSYASVYIDERNEAPGTQDPAHRTFVK